MYDEKQQNIWAYQTMAIDGRCINLTKKINAYLKKNNIGFDKTMERMVISNNGDRRQMY